MQPDLDRLMVLALEEAAKGLAQGEVPIGAVLADAAGDVLASAHNQPIAARDPTAHAEILALRAAGRRVQNYRLSGTILVVTLEPCLMCMGAALHARVEQLVYGASDPKGGAVSLFGLPADLRLNHRLSVVAGVRAQECRQLMQCFFRSRRDQNKAIRRGEVPKWS